ncbi:MAG: pantoate--beta-alanine ligase [Actinobacteria bacterium]|nr:pantoate--beta-alanine ligase [Actinomycetota bacterium]
MKVVRTIADARRAIDALRDGRRVGFVPTMGALHEGHLSLIRLARETCDVVVLSIFVNPLQFSPSEDLDKYPRDEHRDLEKAERERVDVVFLPSVEEMYPPGATVRVSAGELGEILEGASRPGHFDGVATVVTKLFNVVRPDVAVFGQKDAQQVAVVRSLVRDLDIGIEILVGPTVREPDGLALSSRNVYLSPEQRGSALSLWRALQAGVRRLNGDADPEAAAKEMWAELTADGGVQPDYAVAVDPRDMGPPRPGGPILLAVAARVGPTRLIDNVLYEAG